MQPAQHTDIYHGCPIKFASHDTGWIFTIPQLVHDQTGTGEILIGRVSIQGNDHGRNTGGGGR